MTTSRNCFRSFSIGSTLGREASARLGSPKLEAAIENDIMSIPRLTAGQNTIRFKVADAARVKGPIEIIYRYQTGAGESANS